MTFARRSTALLAFLLLLPVAAGAAPSYSPSTAGRSPAGFPGFDQVRPAPPPSLAERTVYAPFLAAGLAVTWAGRYLVAAPLEAFFRGATWADRMQPRSGVGPRGGSCGRPSSP